MDLFLKGRICSPRGANSLLRRLAKKRLSEFLHLMVYPFTFKRICVFFARFQGGNISDAVLNGSSVNVQLDMTSKYLR